MYALSGLQIKDALGVAGSSKEGYQDAYIAGNATCAPPGENAAGQSRVSGLGSIGFTLRAKTQVSEDLRQPARLAELEKGFRVRDYSPSPKGLVEGLTREQFERSYGGVGDARFRAELAALKKRVRALPGHAPKR